MSRPDLRAAAEERAQRLLKETGSASTLPIPVEAVARGVGAQVRYRPFEVEDVSGMLLREEGASPVIGVNSANSKQRQRFTVAHELGHLLLHEGKPLIVDRLVRVNFRDATSSLATDEQEMQANAFAAALLMPPALVEEQMGVLLAGRPKTDPEMVEALARRFGVSRPAMEFRLVNLGFLTPS